MTKQLERPPIMPLSRACPICGKNEDQEHKPFCSDRCRQVDLHRWLTEGYRVPGQPDESSRADGEEDR